MATSINNYHVEFTPNARKIIDRLDSEIRPRIFEWIEANLEGCKNPRSQGKALKGKAKRNWRYRVGKYRIVADIQDDKVIILVVDVDKRNDIYKKKNFLK